MRNLKKFFAVVLVVALMITSMATAFAATTPAGTDEGNALKELGLYTGIDGDLALSKTIVRYESMVMLGKILGIEEAAEAEYATVAAAKTALAAKFTDTATLPDWAVKTIAYEVSVGMVQGGDKLLQPNAAINAAGFATMIARNVLADETIEPADALALLADAGAFTSAQIAQFAMNTNLTRGVLVQVAYSSLSAVDADGVTVIAKLAENNEDLKAIAIEQGLIVPITIKSVAAIADQTIVAGATTATLPATVSATYSDDSKADVAVVWDKALDNTTVGTATYTGKIEGYEAGITAKVTVTALALAVNSATATNLKEIVINFNLPLDSTKVTTTNFTVAGVNSASATLSADKKTVTVVPAAISATNKADYAVKVLKAVGLAADYSYTVRAFDTTIPAVSSVNLTGPQTFDITFSEPIMTAGTVKVNNGIYGVTLGAVGTNKVTVSLSASSLPEGNYTVNVSGFKDYAGFSVDSTDNTLAYVKNTTAPVASISGTPTQTKVVVVFDKAVTLDATNAYKDYFYHTFSAWAPDSVVSAGGTATDKTWTLTFTTYPIPQGTANLVVKYKGTVTNSEIKDAWGNKDAANMTLPVTVTADVTAPSVTSVAVTNEKTVVINFSESLSAASALAIAQNAANYVVKDSAGTAVTTTFTADYSETPADSVYKVTLNFASKLTGGNYTVDIKNIADGALTNNIMPTVTQTFAITDLTPIDFAVATDVVVTAIESTTANVADVMYVTFAEKMATEGQYSVLEPTNYLLNGAALPSGSTVVAFGSTGKVVKITVPENAAGNAQTLTTLTIARVADLAGNKTVALAGTEAIGAEGLPTVLSVKQTDSNKATVTINKPLSVVLASGFTAGTGAGKYEVAAIDSWSINSSNQTVVNVTLNANNATSTTNTSAIIANFDIVPNILVAETGTKMDVQNCAALITDNRAPKLIATSPIVSGTALGTIEVKFTEALDATVAALYANDIVVTKADGTVLVPGLGYTTALKGGDATTIVISFPAAFAANTTYKVYSKETINYIRDAVVGINTKAAAFTTSVDAIAVDNTAPVIAVAGNLTIAATTVTGLAAAVEAGATVKIVADGAGSAAAAAGSGTVVATATGAFAAITGLTTATAYDVYVIDAAGNVSAKLDITTL